MDDVDNVNEVDMKYWHIVDNSIFRKRGLKAVEGIKENGEHDSFLAVVGQFSSFAPTD